jgi:hypothetical protein
MEDDGIQKRHGDKDKGQGILEQKIEQAHGRIHFLPVRFFPAPACFILRRHCQGGVGRRCDNRIARQDELPRGRLRGIKQECHAHGNGHPSFSLDSRFRGNDGIEASFRK